VSRRLLLIRHAATAGTRHAVFGDDGDLTEGSRSHAQELRRLLPTPRVSFASPAVCAQQTAAALGLTVETDPALADWEPGAWRGRTLAELSAAELTAWRTDPVARPAGGESLVGLVARVGGWMDGLCGAGGTTAAVTHAAVIRAAVVHALGVAPEVFWALDVAPSSVTDLRLRDGRWHVGHVNWEPGLIHVPRLGRRRGRTRTGAAS
jgi:broad specificity phosphatase PhoE